MTPAEAPAPVAPSARPTVRWPPRPGYSAPGGAATAADPVPTRPLAPLVLLPDGRARRVLDHVAGGVFQINAILSATNPRTYSRKVERTRIHRILQTMARAGLVRLINGHGWTATAAGVAALRALAADTQSPERSAAR